MCVTLSCLQGYLPASPKMNQHSRLEAVFRSKQPTSNKTGEANASQPSDEDLSSRGSGRKSCQSSSRASNRTGKRKNKTSKRSSRASRNQQLPSRSEAGEGSGGRVSTDSKGTVFRNRYDDETYRSSSSDGMFFFSFFLFQFWIYCCCTENTQ